MSSNPKLRNSNELVSDLRDLLRVLNDPVSLLVLHLMHKRGFADADRISKEIGLPAKQVFGVLKTLQDVDLVAAGSGQSDFDLTALARNRLESGTFSLEFLTGTTIESNLQEVSNPLGHSYSVEKLIGRGATSFTFKAKQSGTYIDRALKVFLPGSITYDQLDMALQKRCNIHAEGLPDLVDVGEVTLRPPSGQEVIVPCVTFEYIDDAQTFARFLRDEVNPNPKLFERFIERVGGALAAIESVGLSHGDLHENNILVVSGGAEFWVIDFIGVPSSPSPHLEIASDLQNFRDHLLRAALIAWQQYPGISARSFLGSRVFQILEGLRANSYGTFKEMLNVYNSPPKEIPPNYFDTPKPQPFEWLRVESIPSSEMLYTLFEPYQLRFDILKRFGNSWISGPRGCGKSHYLRVLAFHPDAIVKAKEDVELADKLERIGYNFREGFGVLFACRLGEFKMFAPEAVGAITFDLPTQAFLKHILVLKIFNKTLYAINEGLETYDGHGTSVLQYPEELTEFLQFFEKRLGKMSIVESLNALSAFKQACAICSAHESLAISVWHEPSRRAAAPVLDERDLDAFFSTLKRTFPDLKHTRFYILVDDASYGQVHEEMQKILNSLVRSIDANHCFKITFDKLMYTLDTADNRVLDPNNEGTYVDLGETTSPTQRGKAANLSKYMAKVINLRLKVANYESDIQTILGKSQSAAEFLSALSLPGSRRPKKGAKKTSRPVRKRAYYAGWNIVWSLSHGSIRTLLELIEHVFKTNDVLPHVDNIPLKAQDLAVRNYSHLRHKQILMLPGEFEGERLGEHLQAVLTAIGEMSRQYLERYPTGDPLRWYETISLERKDRDPLNPKAARIFRDLIKNGFLLDEGTTFTRAQFGLSWRYDMNKIFAPTFQTTYRVRNHLYVNRKGLQELLLRPVDFVSRHKARLGTLIPSSGTPDYEPSLFELNENVESA